MRSIEEYEAENLAAIARHAAKQLDALKRLKQRIARVTRSTGYTRRDINRCVDEWWTAEVKRGAL